MMSFTRLTLRQWQSERIQEAREHGYSITLVFKGTIALYFNGPYFCYLRTYEESTQ